ncbi:hypothetical protein QG516_03635 [Pedobacter gandavensis]|uniref:hypothetical protein n=1 Tax=Pedobacter gandavensis TaxID=2679963 RepID=UPI00247899CE|nr:hypothetical protein [Pedobacter gandavensis]WGQ10745.1 hypothetical protein QG516_03635 [Pedobacter gandavensis]
MILQHFSWQGLLVVFLVFSMVWYAAVLLLFYRKDLSVFFNSKILVSGVPLQRSAVADKKIGLLPADIDRAEDIEAEIMGKSRLPEGMSVISADLIRFSAQVAAASPG